MEKIYSFAEGYSCPLSANVVHEELEKIRAQHGGILSATDVVEAARNHSHPLHECFCWDDRKAALEYRKNEARALIRSVRVICPDDDVPIKMIQYLSVVDPDKGRGYQPSSRVMSDAELKSQAINDCLVQLQALKRRYGHLNELAAVFAKIPDTKLG